MDLPRPTGAGHTGKTEGDVGLDLISDCVNVNALEVDVRIVAIKHLDGFRKDRRQRYPVVSQHKPPSVIEVKIAQGQRSRVAARRARCAFAAVGHTPRYENAVV